MPETKKDLIDLVREGKQIEIYETGKELKEGDVIRDWESMQGIETRRVVGKSTGFRIFGWLLFAECCSYCGYIMHHKIKEKKWYRLGRDGRKYYKHLIQDDGHICPLCEDTTEKYVGYY